MYKKNQRRLAKALSAFMAAALVFTSFPSQAKTKKTEVTEIQITSPYSAKGKTVTTTLTLKKGSTFKVKTSVFPQSASKTLVYKSSKKKIASISKKGKIKANKVGKTKITIQPKSNKKVKAVITVTVVKKLKKVKKIALSQSSLSLSPNGSAQLNASIVSPKKPTTKNFNWFTSDANVAAVNKKGLVTAKAAGSADITVTSADGQGAKTVCRVTVTDNSTPVSSGTPSTSSPAAPGISSSGPSGNPTNPSQNPAGPSGNPANPSQNPAGPSGNPANPSQNPAGPSGSPANPSQNPAGPSGNPANPSASPSSVPANSLTIVIPGERTGIKQGESMQLTAAGPGADQVSWSVSEVTGVTISKDGLLTVASSTGTGKKIQITASTSANVTAKSATASLTVVENQIQPLTENQLQLNVDTKDNPLGLTYRSPDAHSIVTDPERGEVVRFDANEGYTSNSYDVLAWMQVDPMYAGKTVTISAYMKYESSTDLTGNMNLVLNEGWNHSNPAKKYNADPDTWYYITGTYKLTSDPGGYSETSSLSRLYIARDAEHLKADRNAVYYIDDLRFTVEKSVVEDVTLSSDKDADTIYQNHTLQFSSKVTGINNPMQKVNYSIEPAVAGASIDDKGLLTVENAAADSTITVKATSVEDPKKFATKTITVLGQSIDSITVTAAGKVTRIYPNNTLQFTADVSTTGEPETTVTWKLNPEVSGATISDKGLLSVGELAEGTEITVEATATLLSDSTKTASATYKVTILGDYVAPHVVKPIQSNQWDAFTKDYYCNLKYDADKESVYIENGTANLSGTGSKRASIGFLVNSDGSAFDASAYNTLSIHLKCDASENATKISYGRLRVYSSSDTGYKSSTSVISGSAKDLTSSEQIWRIPISDLAAKDISLVDIKALSLEPGLSSAGVGLEIYSFTFENLSEYEPYKVTVTQPNSLTLLKENASMPLAAAAQNSAGEPLENVNMTWTSSDENIATVSEDGRVTGVSAGKVTIYATAVDSVAMAGYDITVYDDTPVETGFEIAGTTYTSTYKNRPYITINELINGVPITAVSVNAAGEKVSDSSEEVTVTIDRTSVQGSSGYYALTAEYKDGKIIGTVTDHEERTKDYGFIDLNITVGSNNSVFTTIEVYNGIRIPTSSATMYNATSGKASSDIAPSTRGVTIEASSGVYSGLGFKYTLPDGEKLSKYKKVLFSTGGAVDEYPFSLYMPANGWNAESITCNTADSKQASTDTPTAATGSGTDALFSLALTESEADTNVVHFAIGFGDDTAIGNLTVRSILLIE